MPCRFYPRLWVSFEPWNSLNINGSHKFSGIRFRIRIQLFYNVNRSCEHSPDQHKSTRDSIPQILELLIAIPQQESIPLLIKNPSNRIAITK